MENPVLAHFINPEAACCINSPLEGICASSSGISTAGGCDNKYSICRGLRRETSRFRALGRVLQCAEQDLF